MVNIIDLFAGAGGLSNGFEQTGNFNVIGAVEINEAAIKTYNHNHIGDANLIIRQGDKTVSDISKIDFSEFLIENDLSTNARDIVVIGGPPCQGFSNANRQKNYLISGNNQLVKEYVRAIDEIRPAAFLMENVKTINSKTHKFFVTNHTNAQGIDRYSSRKHLDEILLENEELVEKDSMLIVDTSILELKKLFEELCEHFNDTNYIIRPILNEGEELSTFRGIVRKLKKNEVFEPDTSKQNEILNLRNNISNYRIPKQLKSVDLFRSVSQETVEVLDILIAGENSSNKDLLKRLQPFSDLEKLLRFFEELRTENILLEGTPFIKEGTENKIIIMVNVFSYNVVDYLCKVFRYMGYGIKEEVIHALNYLVPQKRERFMLLGIREDILGNREVEFPVAIINSENPLTSVEEAISDLENVEPQKEITKNYNEQKYSLDRNLESRLLNYYRSNMLEEDVIYNHVNTASRETSIERYEVLNNMEEGNKNFHSLPDELKNNTYSNAERTQNTVYLKLRYDLPSPTVINVRKSMWQHPNKPRAISIREAARLQSFKDNFIFLGTKDQQYQQIGNAVPPLMARAVAEKILEYLNQEVLYPIKRIL